jgi:hypothetical protein
MPAVFMQIYFMSKTACKDKDLKVKEDARFICKKCEATVKKEKHACKPKRLKKGD